MNQYKDIPDFLFAALSNPSVRQSKEFQQWIQENEENCLLFEELLTFYEAGCRQLSSNVPNLELQWARIKKNNRQTYLKRRITFLSITGIAASLLLAFAIHLLTQNSIQELQTIETKVSLSPIIEQPTTTVVTRTKKKVHPILLSTTKGETTAVHTSCLDYTQPSPNTATSATEWLTLTTPRGKSIRVVLADSTEVWLNAESILKYPSQFTDSLRIVHLEGEAYFKVAHNQTQPFVVNHHSTATRALGTEFNIRSYRNAPKHHVTLVKGKVLITDTLSQHKEYLLPGQDAEYHSASEITVKEVNLQEFTAWKEDLFYFEQTELMELMQTIGRWYNATIAFETEELKHYRFTFWAKRSDSLKTTLTMLNQIGTVRIQLNTEAKQVFVSKR